MAQAWSTLKKVLLGFILLLVIVIGLSFAMTAGVAKATKTFITDISAGNVGRAYDNCSQLFKDSTSLEQFEAFVDGSDIFTHLDNYSLKSKDIVNGKALVSGKLNSTEGETKPFSIYLNKEDGVWKVVSISFEQNY